MMELVSSNIKVAIRVRPLNDREGRSNQTSGWAIQPEAGQIQQISTADGRAFSGPSYSFDAVFGPELTCNRELFDRVARSIVDDTLEGVNGTIFAYGQTSTGKTFTMQGDKDNPGLIPLSIRYIFQAISKIANCDFSFKCSYLEIYNEVITDLLCPQKTNLKIHETIEKGIFVGDLSEESVVHAVQAYGLVLKGEENRHTSATNMNEHSSRSHTIFRLTIQKKDRQECVTTAVLNFVDLAGSERVGYTGAEGVRLKEGGHINKSLLALATVISKLSEGKDSAHIPFRNSKLTRILQPSLGGNAHTAIICGMTPATIYIEETLSTLKFAARAKRVKNAPQKNEILTLPEMLRRYKLEIERLRALIAPEVLASCSTKMSELFSKNEESLLTLSSEVDEIEPEMDQEKELEREPEREQEREQGDYQEREKREEEELLDEEISVKRIKLNHIPTSPIEKCPPPNPPFSILLQDLNKLQIIRFDAINNVKALLEDAAKVSNDIMPLKHLMEAIAEDAKCIVDDFWKKFKPEFYNLHQQFRFAKIEYSASISACSELQSNVQKRDQTIAQLEDELSTYKERITVLEANSARIKELEAEADGMTKEWNSIEESLMDQLAKLDSEKEALLKQLKESKHHQYETGIINLTGIQSALDNLESAIGSFEQTDRDSIELEFTKRLDKLSGENDDLRVQLVNRQTDIDELLAKMAKLQQDSRNNCIAVTIELEKANLLTGTLKTQLKDLEEEKKHLQERETSAICRADSLQSRLDSSLHMQQIAEEALAVKQDEYQENCHKLESLTARITEAHLMQNNLENEKALLVEELARLRETCKKLSQDKEKQLEELALANNLKDTEFAKITAENFKLSADLKAYQRQLQEVQSSYAEMSRLRLQEETEAKHKLGDIEFKFEQLKSEREERKHQCEKLEHELSMKCEEIVKIASEKAVIESRLNSELCSLEKELMALEEKNEQAKAKFDAEVVNFKAALASDQVALLQANEEKERLRKLCEKFRDQIESLETNLANVNSTISSQISEAQALAKAEWVREKAELEGKVKNGLEALAAQSVNTSNAASYGIQSSKTEILLRVELDKLRETLGRERKLASLKVAESEDQLAIAMTQIAELKKQLDSKHTIPIANVNSTISSIDELGKKGGNGEGLLENRSDYQNIGSKQNAEASSNPTKKPTATSFTNRGPEKTTAGNQATSAPECHQQ